MRLMTLSILCCLAGPTSAGGLQDPAGGARSAVSDWMTENDGVLELKLAHEEKDRPDGGILRVDSRRRLVTWEGIKDEVGCRRSVEASFDDVKRIGVSDLAGFVIEFKTGKERKLVLIPVPHAWWFVQQWVSRGENLATIPEGTLRDHDGGMTVSGAASGAGPRVRHREIPKDVVKDTRAAANAVLAALGRKELR